MANNKLNTLYFENESMKGLYDDILAWQIANQKRLLSLNIQKDGSAFSCIALTNPTEVVLTNHNGNCFVEIDSRGRLFVRND